MSALSAAIAFENMILNDAYPCVSAKAALHRGQLEILSVGDMNCPANDNTICSALQAFAAAHSHDDVFVSHAVIFTGPNDLDDAQFERSLWSRLYALHELDKRKFSWDPLVSADPDSPRFSMSIGGRGFYVVGLHPNAARASRRFQSPALVFNLHSQFDALRDQSRYETIRDATLARDSAFCGSDNAELKGFGEESEARQYSGRQNSRPWTCPFQGKFAP